MNKRQIIASLNNIANSLEYSGLYSEANTITKVMVKLAEEEKMKTKHSQEELQEAMSEQGAEKAFSSPNSTRRSCNIGLSTGRPVCGFN